MSSEAPLTLLAAAPPSTMVPPTQLCSADRSPRPKQRHRRQRQDPVPRADATVASEQRLLQLCHKLLRAPLQQPSDAQPQARQQETAEKVPPMQLCSTRRGTRPRPHCRQQRQDPAPRADAAAASEQRLVQLCHKQFQQPAGVHPQVRQLEAEEKAFPNSANNLAQLCRNLIFQQGQRLQPGSDAALQPRDSSGPPGRWHTAPASSQVTRWAAAPWVPGPR